MNGAVVTDPTTTLTKNQTNSRWRKIPMKAKYSKHKESRVENKLQLVNYYFRCYLMASLFLKYFLQRFS